MVENKATTHCKFISCETQINEQAKCVDFFNLAANPRSNQRRREEYGDNQTL